jgi:histidine triad (HIT) family protein
MKTMLLPLAAALFLTATTTAQTFSLQDFAPLYKMQGFWAAPTVRGLECEQWEIDDPYHLQAELEIIRDDTFEMSAGSSHLYFQDGRIVFTSRCAYECPNDTFQLTRIDQGKYIFERKTGEESESVVYQIGSDSVLEKHLEVPSPYGTDKYSFRYEKTGKVSKYALLNPDYLQRKAKALGEPSVFQHEIDRKFPEHIFFQDSLVTVFRSNNAQLPLHLLVVPNRRIPTLNDATQADESLLGHMLLTARDAAKRTTAGETGYRLAINTNEDAGQSAFHLHLHVLGGTRTGPMVDQGWRNVRRRLADSTHITPFEKRILGYWVSKTPTAEASMKWEPDLQNKFIMLSYKLESHPVAAPAEVFEGKAFYKNAGKPGVFTAQWMDSNGDVFPVKGQYNGQEFNTLWGGTGATQLGKSVYRFVDDTTIELTDWRRNGKGEWEVFNRFVFRKA